MSTVELASYKCVICDMTIVGVHPTSGIAPIVNLIQKPHMVYIDVHTCSDKCSNELKSCTEAISRQFQRIRQKFDAKTITQEERAWCFNPRAAGADRLAWLDKAMGKKKSSYITVHAVMEPLEPVQELTPAELEEYRRHEITIETGIKTWLAVGIALLAIREKRLYRTEYATFEDYIRNRWSLGRSRAYQFMDAVTVARNLEPIEASASTIVDIPTLPSGVKESHLRPLMTLKEPKEQRQAWAEAKRVASGRVPTARQVKTAVQEVKQRLSKVADKRTTSMAKVAPSKARVSNDSPVSAINPNEPAENEDADASTLEPIEGSADKRITPLSITPDRWDDLWMQWRSTIEDWYESLPGKHRELFAVNLSALSRQVLARHPSVGVEDLDTTLA